MIFGGAGRTIVIDNGCVADCDNASVTCAVKLNVPGVVGVHDLHLWSVAGDDASLTAHIAIADGGSSENIRRAVVGMLETQFNIHHATIQTETEPCGDEESLHA